MMATYVKSEKEKRKQYFTSQFYLIFLCIVKKYDSDIHNAQKLFLRSITLFLWLCCIEILFGDDVMMMIGTAELVRTTRHKRIMSDFLYGTDPSSKYTISQFLMHYDDDDLVDGDDC